MRKYIPSFDSADFLCYFGTFSSKVYGFYVNSTGLFFQEK